MRYADFEALVERLMQDVPSEFLVGVPMVEVSRKVVPHPTRPEVYTLGECIPLPGEGPGEADAIRSRVVLYYGSFAALAGQTGDFDWRAEAWETLTHEIRHHLEWRARTADLELFDWAAEQNFARIAGELFDPDFYLSAEQIADGVYRIDDDYFIDRPEGRIPPELTFEWHGARFDVRLPSGTTTPAFLTVTGVSEPPPGELVLVLREPRRLRHLLRAPARPYMAEVMARPV